MALWVCADIPKRETVKSCSDYLTEQQLFSAVTGSTTTTGSASVARNTTFTGPSQAYTGAETIHESQLYKFDGANIVLWIKLA